ncbi:hypothetical protein D3C87_1987160 [compost metagenome]
MPLAHRAVSREKIEVLLPFHIPQKNARAPFDHYRHRFVVMRAEAVFEVNGVFGGADIGRVCIVWHRTSGSY